MIEARDARTGELVESFSTLADAEGWCISRGLHGWYPTSHGRCLTLTGLIRDSMRDGVTVVSGCRWCEA